MMPSHLHHFPVQRRSNSAHARGACPFGSEIPCGVQVGVESVATRTALKCGLCLAVLPLRVATTATALRGMARIFFNHLYACQCCFVVDEGEQLGKRPTMHHAVDLFGQL